MKKIVSSLLITLAFIGGISQGVHAVGPNTPPPGGYTGGVFSVYFKNIIEGAGSSPTGKCPSGYGIVGYSSTQDSTYGTPICEAISGSSTSLWYQNGSDIYNTGANVGIGTSTPGAKLEVNGQVKITGGTPGPNKVLVSDASGLASWASAPAPCVPGGSGVGNTCYGIGALGINTNGTQNTAYGYNALFNNDFGYGNVAVGDSTLYTNYNGTDNTAVGSNSLYSNTSGRENTAIGSDTLSTNTSGHYNSSLGFRTLKSNTSGMYNSAVGHKALTANTTGNQNTAIGISALGANTSGSWNTAAGVNALQVSTSGMFNSAYGVYSLFSLGFGDENTALGYAALQSLGSGYSNIALGAGAGSYLTSGNGNIFIGSNAQPNVSNTSSNQLNIGNWIYGNNGKIGIAVTNPTAKLDISDNPAANTASFRITSPSNGFVQYFPNMSAGGWNSAVQSGDHGLIFSTDNNASVSSNGLVLGAWNGGGVRIGENGIFRVQTLSGYVDIGPQNTGYSHFSTDRAEFYMNKKLNVDGQISRYGVSNQWADINANTYMANTSIYSYGRICVGNGSGDCTGAGGAVLGDNDSAAIALQTDGNIKMRNTSPTIYLRDTDNRSAMIHNNSNVVYFLRGCGNDSASWCANGSYWPLTVNLETNDVTIGGSAYANNYYYLSDKNLKKNIAPLTGSLEKLLKLSGYSFNWKNTGKKDIGVIAQDVEKVFPEIVGESKDANGTVNKTVQYGNLVAPVIEALRELATKQKNLEKEVEALKKENTTLLQRLEKLEAKIK